MANGKSAFATANDNTANTRATAANYYDYNWVRGIRRDTITALGNEADLAYHDMGPIVRDGTILVPEQSRIRHGGAGLTTTITIPELRLERVIYKAAPITALTWVAASSVVTVTTTAKHGFVKGQVIQCSASSNQTTLLGTAASPTSKTITDVLSDYVFKFAATDASTVSTPATATLGPAAGSIQPLTASLEVTAITASQPFVAVDGLFLPTLLVNDRLRFTLKDWTAFTAARTVMVELALDVPRA